MFDFNRQEYPKFPFLELKATDPGPSAFPEIEVIPQKENTFRLAVRFPCGCMRIGDISLDKLEPNRAANVARAGEYIISLLEQLIKEAEERHGGLDPKPIITG